jgi:hypothetical protein
LALVNSPFPDRSFAKARRRRWKRPGEGAGKISAQDAAPIGLSRKRKHYRE